jgi:hypothetical protein
MKNIAANGFACPCCRSEMAEQIVEDDDDDESYYEEEYDNYNEDYALRGMRWFMNRIENIDDTNQEPEDAEAESEDSEEEVEEDQEKDGYIVSTGGLRLPTPKYIMEKLQEKNITAEALITSLLLLEHDDSYALNETTHHRMNTTKNQVYGAFRAIVNQFRP